jgi:hypothetical protein
MNIANKFIRADALRNSKPNMINYLHQASQTWGFNNKNQKQANCSLITKNQNNLKD